MDRDGVSTYPSGLVAAVGASALMVLLSHPVSEASAREAPAALQNVIDCRDDACLLERLPERPVPPGLIQAGELMVSDVPAHAGSRLLMPTTTAAIRIVASGAVADADGDGVADGLDVCGATPMLEPVNRFGCRAIRQRLATVPFDLAATTLSLHAERLLEPVAATLRQQADLRVALAAYTDDTGSDQANLRLSRRRADAVAEHLASLGVSPSRLIPTPYGERSPVADNADAPGRAQNRRVEITVLADKGFMKGGAGAARSDAPTDVRSRAAGRIDD